MKRRLDSGDIRRDMKVIKGDIVGAMAELERWQQRDQTRAHELGHLTL